MKSLIVIPARYGSSRLPGKPMAKIAGKTMLQRVCEVARQAVNHVSGTRLLVATDDERILSHAKDLGVDVVMTPKHCSTGTDRILSAIESLPASQQPENVINLQGDAPLTPAFVLQEMLGMLANSQYPVVTPVVQLPWKNLDQLRSAKAIQPFSGTLAIINKNDEALWFSKQIIPAIRQEDAMREAGGLSPVFQHLGLYGYKTESLKMFGSLSKGTYEQLEGLEQLRFLEHGYKIKVLKLDAAVLPFWRGVDTQEDIDFVESVLVENTQKGVA